MIKKAICTILAMYVLTSPCYATQNTTQNIVQNTLQNTAMAQTDSQKIKFSNPNIKPKNKSEMKKKFLNNIESRLEYYRQERMYDSLDQDVKLGLQYLKTHPDQDLKKRLNNFTYTMFDYVPDKKEQTTARDYFGMSTAIVASPLAIGAGIINTVFGFGEKADKGIRQITDKFKSYKTEFVIEPEHFEVYQIMPAKDYKRFIEKISVKEFKKRIKN